MGTWKEQIVRRGVGIQWLSEVLEGGLEGGISSLCYDLISFNHPQVHTLNTFYHPTPKHPTMLGAPCQVEPTVDFLQAQVATRALDQIQTLSHSLSIGHQVFPFDRVSRLNHLQHPLAK